MDDSSTYRGADDGPCECIRDPVATRVDAGHADQTDNAVGGSLYPEGIIVRGDHRCDGKGLGRLAGGERYAAVRERLEIVIALVGARAGTANHILQGGSNDA